jgi:hypothetical protein
MLSPGVFQMLDQVRSEFGVEVEIVDANLVGAWAPEGQRAPRLLAGPELRTIGMEVLRAGRASVVSVDGREYQLVPLRNSRSVSPAALMTMRVAAASPERREEHDSVAGFERYDQAPRVDEAQRYDRAEPFGATRSSDAHVGPWVEVLRGAIEADLSSREEIDGERQQARAVRGALRFVTYLASATTAREVAEAAIQAAAVWFDTDARVYRRRPGGDYVLVAALPGAEVPPTGHLMSELALGLEAPFIRAAPAAGLAGGREGIVVPMAVSTGVVEWVLVLLGAVPIEADVTLEALGRVLGLQMERLALTQAAATRTTFEDILVRGDRAIELTALDVLRELVSRTSGSGAALWIQDGEELRRIAAVGAPDASGPASETEHSTTRHQVRSFTLGSTRRARLELRAGSDAPFDSDAPLVADACASVLRAWLPAALHPAAHASPLVLPSNAADFARRIDEELARAKRFDRDLALVVVESGVLAWPQDTTDRLVDVLRAELRGSDVLGLVGEQRVVVLLIETHESAVSTVVRRLRERLGRAIPELKLPGLALGQAAFSTSCATADALLSQAAVNAETITVPA